MKFIPCNKATATATSWTYKSRNFLSGKYCLVELSRLKMMRSRLHCKCLYHKELYRRLILLYSGWL